MKIRINKKIFIILFSVLILSACSKQNTQDNQEQITAPTTSCGNGICEVFVECPEKNCPPSEYPNTCPEDCKLSCAWTAQKTFCNPKYTNLKGEYIRLDSALSYIVENYSCNTSLDCPFSHKCTDVKFNDPSIEEARICIFNPLDN